MREFIIKCIAVSAIFLLVVILINLFADPSNIFSDEMIKEGVSELSQGHIIAITGDMDERIYQELRIKSLEKAPDTVILGSSHVMMVPWDFDCYVAGVSSAVLEDYIGILGIFETVDKLPRRVIIGVDPWIFDAECSENRYRSIQNYLNYELKAINHEDAGDPPLHGSSLISRFDKLKELVSFSYFQASVYSIKSVIFDDAVTGITREDNAEYGERMKIMPNGRFLPRAARFMTADECTANAKQALGSDNVFLVSGFEELSEEKMVMFEQMVDYLLKKNVSVEFYLPAWFPDYYEAFTCGGEYAGVIKAESYVRSMAEERNIVVHGSYDPAATGNTRDDFMDDLHLKPEIMLQQFKYIA